MNRSEHALQLRISLLEALCPRGPFCHGCGASCDLEALEIDHVDGRTWSHRVYIAAPQGRAGAVLCRELGIGVLRVQTGQFAHVTEMAPSRRWNSRPIALATKLCPEHKTHARAGATTGGHWSPFRATCKQLVARVRDAGSEGIALKDAIATKYHYSSLAGARSGLATWAREGRIAGVRLEAGRLYATEVAP